MAKTDPREIQSLARGLEVLELLSTHDQPMGVTQIASIVNYDKSTVYRLLTTLVNRGYVVQDLDTRRYMPGLQILTLSRLVINRIELRTIAKPFIKHLKQITGESAHLAVLENDRVIYIDNEETDATLNVQTSIGQDAPFHCTAIGKTLIAHNHTADELRELINPQELLSYTQNTITDVNTLLDDLRKTCEQGFALDNEEFNLGVRCISSPIFDHRNKVVAAIGISGPSLRVTDEKLPDLIETVKFAATQISHRIGKSR